MKKNLVFLFALLGFMALGTGITYAGIEPSPFEPEINKLHSIELGVAAINSRIAKVNESAAAPEGTANYLAAMASQMQTLKARMSEVLLVLPELSPTSPFVGQDEVVFSLDSIRANTRDTMNIVTNITSRMGIGPSPFYPQFRDVSISIIGGLNSHLFLVLDPIPLPLILGN